MHPGLSLARKLQTILPWTVLVASMASSLIHWSVGGVIIMEETEDKIDGAEVDADSQEWKGGSLMLEDGSLEKK